MRAHQKYEIFSSKLRNYLKLVRIKKHKLWHVENGGLWLTSTRLWVQTQAGSPVWGLHVYQWKMHLLKPFLAQVPSLLNSSSIFLSLDSNRADFMIHSLKYVFLFCFVFSSTLVQPWVHAFSETSARSHVDEQQNTPF